MSKLALIAMVMVAALNAHAQTAGTFEMGGSSNEDSIGAQAVAEAQARANQNALNFCRWQHLAAKQVSAFTCHKTAAYSAAIVCSAEYTCQQAAQ